jgi:hypothetical protein
MRRSLGIMSGAFALRSRAFVPGNRIAQPVLMVKCPLKPAKANDSRYW